MRVAIDCETTGLDPNEHGILTLALVKMDDDLNCVDMDYINIRSELKKIETEAMIINRIDLIKHNEEALPRYLAASHIEHILYDWSNHGTDRISFLGHGVNFDIGFLKSVFGPKGLKRIERFIGHRHIDTHSVLLTLKDAGIYSGSSMKLEDAVNFYNTQFFGEFHDARTDALAVAYLYKNIVSQLEDMIPYYES